MEVKEVVNAVSVAAIVKVLLPESRVKVFDPEERREPAPTKVRESMSRTDPSTETCPKSPPSLMVTEPVEALTSNSVKSMAVAPPVIEVKLVPVRVVPPFNVRFPALDIVNLVVPEDEAVNISPSPELSTTREAKDVAPEIEAVGRVPEILLTSRVAKGEAELIPTFPLREIVPVPVEKVPVPEIEKLPDD
ncbi:MAG: hypothetical protein HY377_00030 [Candidatus Blackburnbacteria bacterium]|nr:hypothetical protein [Candidatus Blackburnbacteria bacterium]